MALFAHNSKKKKAKQLQAVIQGVEKVAAKLPYPQSSSVKQHISEAAVALGVGQELYKTVKSVTRRGSAILLLVTPLFLCACASTKYTAPDGSKLTQHTLFMNSAVKGLAVSPKTGLKIARSNADVDDEALDKFGAMIERASEGAVKGAVKGVK
jgi:hypothetical protein